jgi:putative inorganic carbon (hco3(-)) transporter
MQQIGRRAAGSEFFWTGIALVVMLGACAVIAASLLTVSPTLVAAGVLAALACGLILYYPYVGIIVFLGLLFLRLDQFFPLIMKLRLPMLVSSFTLFAWLVQVVTKRATFRGRPELAWTAAFAATMVLSSYKVPGISNTVEAVLHGVKLWLMVLLLHQLLNSEQRASAAIKFLLFFTVCLSLSGVYGWLTGTTALNEHGTLRAQIGVGDFDDPNDLAAGLVIAVPIALLLLLRGESALTRLWGGLSLCALLAGIYLCNSRGGMLALGVGVGVFMIHHLGWTRGCLLGMVALALMFLFGPDRFSPDTMAGDDSSMGRIHAWEAGLRMFTHSPLIGVGYNQFEENHTIPAHNSFVHALAEAGFLNAMAWIGMNYWAILTLTRLRRRKEAAGSGESLTAYGAALQAAVLASLTAGMFLSHAYRAVPLVPVGLAIALGSLGGVRPRSRFGDLPHYLVVPLLTVGMVVLIYIATKVLQ